MRLWSGVGEPKLLLLLLKRREEKRGGEEREREGERCNRSIVVAHVDEGSRVEGDHCTSSPKRGCWRSLGGGRAGPPIRGVYTQSTIPGEGIVDATL
jgi:hypothetical protein